MVVAAAQRGTIVSVEGLFHNLPVRRRELERNIKREWQKVIALLGQYACIQTNVRLSVSQQPTKGKRVALFSTKGNPTTRENIINIFGAKTMATLTPLDLHMEMQPTTGFRPDATAASTSAIVNKVSVVGHISRPTPGDGRKTPDRQMFFVNGRPCGLPQFAKTFNEVYRSYNNSQSPFIFADVQLDIQMYDVNVSPDKRSILLHDQGRLLDTLRASLIAIFDSHDCAVPVSQVGKDNRGSDSHDGVARPITPSFINSKPRTDETAGNSDESTLVESSQHHAATNVSHMWCRPGNDQNLISQWLEMDMSTSSSTQPVSGRVSRRRGSNINPAIGMASNTHGASPSAHVFAAPVEDSLYLSRPAVESTSQPADNNPEKTGPTSHSTPSSVHSLTDDDGLGERSDVRAVQPLRLGDRGPRRAHSFLYPPRRMAMTIPTTGDKSPTKDGSFFLEVSDGFGNCHQPRGGEASSEGNGLSSRSTVDEEGALAASAGEMRPTRPAEDSSTIRDNLHDGPKFQSGDLGSKSNVSEATSTQSTTAILPTEGSSRHGSVSSDAAPQTRPSDAGHRRSNMLWQAALQVDHDEENIRSRMDYLESQRWSGDGAIPEAIPVEDISAPDAESKLTLTISRSDFSTMRVIGQFNMGFIIAVRPASPGSAASRGTQYDELLIIDQHASDEKYNFERLQNTTVVQSQRLVHPKKVQLTALEEEIVMENLAAIEANGFQVAVDTSGRSPVGSRCEVLALPLSRETIFSLDDLEELIAMLGDKQADSDHVPRPSKVRKMFAMRACRSSVMIGKALTRNQMCSLVRQMGELDKPWNCPHGRPTMRHLCRVQTCDEKRWAGDTTTCSAAAWQSYATGH